MRPPTVAAIDLTSAPAVSLALVSRMGLEEEKVLVNIHKYGNTTSATLPLLLSDFEDKFKKGDNLIFAAFGGGFTWGSIYLKWAYNKQ